MKKTISEKDILKAINSSSTMEEAAKKLNINRKTLYKKRKKLEIVSKRVNKVEIKKEPKFIEPKNENLVKEYTGRFQERSDKTHKDFKRFVFTSVQNDKKINTQFLKTLELYCEMNQAKLVVCPIYYFFNKMESDFPEEVKKYMIFDNLQINNNLKVLTKLRILPTIIDPMAGLDSISKGQSIIIPHPNVAMKTMATLGGSPAQMYSTGTLTLPEDAYLPTKTGYKAEFNHSKSALMVEFGEGDSFYPRFLNGDEQDGFYDCVRGNEGYYQVDTFTKIDGIDCIVTGDEHVAVNDPEVTKATYLNDDSIVNVLRPKIIVRHDILDSQAVSHHDDKDLFLRWGKQQANISCMDTEVSNVFKHLHDTTPSFARNLIAESNHDNHFYQFLRDGDPKKDLTNAKLFFKMSYLMMNSAEKTEYGVSYPNPMELWLKNSEWVYNNYLMDRVEFLGRRDSYKIHGIEISLHGDKGPNGSRGSDRGFSYLPFKVIRGHSHTPSIRLGCYTVGTSSRMKLGYNSGPSSWMHAHCLVYKNGKRQMIGIINGKWRA